MALLNLGLWQLRRLDQRQTENNLYYDRLELNELGIQDLRNLAESASGDIRQDLKKPEFQNLEFRKIRLTGKYIELDREAVIRNRTLNGRPGVWALTAFQAAGSSSSPEPASTFIINRGWIPRELSSPDCSKGAIEAKEATAPSGEIELVGILRVPQGYADSDQWEKCLPRIQLEGFLDLTGFPYWIQLVEYSSPFAAAEIPTPLDSPDRGDGPHFSYAVQWFIFTAIVAGGYMTILWRRNKSLAQEQNIGRVESAE